MTTDMAGKYKTRRGIALLAVLMIIIVVTILSLSFLSRSDGELAYGHNMLMHSQSEALAESGLEQAKALVLNSQDLSTAAGAYWTGAAGQQLASGDLYYDISVTRHTTGTTPMCSFDIQSCAYRLSGGNHIAESTLAAELRLDPCIALWTGGVLATGTAIRVNGDAYSAGNFSNWHAVNGDVYSGGAIAGTSQGQKHTPATPPVQWPPVTYSVLVPGYYIGTTGYAAAAIGASPVFGYTSSPSTGNPAGIVYYAGNLVLNGATNITGTLVVSGDLTIRGHGNVITAAKNYPAIVVGGKLIVDDFTSLTVNGLVVVSQTFGITWTQHDIYLTINGGLFAGQSVTLNPSSASSLVTITADHTRTALLLWDSSGGHTSWRQAGSAFLKNVRPQP
jgi:hypothetical protein